MIEIKGNLFDPSTYRRMIPPTRGFLPVNFYPSAICVTTNAMMKLSRDAALVGVMGAGVAKQAANLYPDLPKKLANLLLENGHHTQIIQERLGENPPYHIVSFPTKTHWRYPSSIDLIKRSAQELVALAEVEDWHRIVLSRPGCGNGGLEWNSQVRPLLQPILDNRFFIITP